jgi:hypothetical protein
VSHAFTDLLEWESSLTTGATVIVRWTNCNRAYRAKGTISKINSKSILAELAEDVLNPQYTTPECGLLRVNYPVGRKISVPSHSSYRSTSGNRIEPVPVEQPASVKSNPDLSPTPATPLDDIEIPAEDDRLFIGVFPCGISYADRKVEEHGDYKRLAFLSYSRLELEWFKGCPESLRGQIIADAAKIQARRGEDFQISTVGQTIRLGGKL